MTRLIQDSIADGSLVLWHDYRAGHLIDLSGNGNDGVGTDIIWAGREGIAFPLTTSLVTVADSPELQLTAGTLVAYGPLRAQTFAKRLISKRDGGGANYDWYLGIGDINIYDGGITSDINLNVTGTICQSIVFTANAQPDAYSNGLYIGQYDTALTGLAVNDAPLIIGNLYSGSQNLESHLSSVLIFNRQLTATENAQVYSELSENGGPSS